MVLSVKDGFKLIEVAIICFCGVFVCTFFLNYYLDVLPLKDSISEEFKALYDAQIATAKLTCAVTGGVLALISAVVIIFYVKLYIDAHSKQLGILKAMGYSDQRLALGFWAFGFSSFTGCAAGFCAGFIAMPFIYENLTIEGMDEIAIGFHPILLVCLVVLPSMFFTGLACLYALYALRTPALEMIRGKSEKVDKSQKNGSKERAFLAEMCFKTLSAKKSLVFFVAFSCFCFGAMVQMGLSMKNLTSQAMGIMILIIGVVLATVSMFMAVTSLINGNKKNIAVMKVFGYDLKERTLAVLGGYIPFAFLGFGLGTAYQYGLLELMVNIIFADVGEVPLYSFDVPVFFITFALFVVSYALVMLLYTLKINKISVKEVMLEN